MYWILLALLCQVLLSCCHSMLDEDTQSAIIHISHTVLPAIVAKQERGYEHDLKYEHDPGCEWSISLITSLSEQVIIHHFATPLSSAVLSVSSAYLITDESHVSPGPPRSYTRPASVQEYSSAADPCRDDVSLLRAEIKVSFRLQPGYLSRALTCNIIRVIRYEEI